MQIVIPANVIPKQNNLGELFGDFVGTWNIDLTSDLGRIKVAPRTKKINTDSDSGLSTLVQPAGFIRSNARSSDEWWTLCNQRLLISNANSDPRTSNIVDPTANSPTTALDSRYSDIEEFSGNLVVSLKTDIAQLVAGTWTAAWWTSTLSKRAMVTAIPHPLKVIFNNLLLIGDQVVGNNEGSKGELIGQASIHSIDIASNVTLNRLLFKKSLKVTFIISSSTEVWIGLSHIYSGKAQVARWDGSSVNFNNIYKIDDKSVYAGVIKDEVCYVVDGKGRLLKFSGTGFTEVSRLPVASSKYYRWQGALATIPLHKNGIAIIDGKINMLVMGAVNTVNDLLEYMAGGIWEYDENIGLYHKQGITNNLGAGTLDFGSPIVNFPGAIFETEKQYGTFIAGAQVTVDNGGTFANLTFNSDIIDSSGNITDNVLKSGFLITRKIPTGDLEEHWQDMAIKFNKLLNTTDQVYIKYRTDFKNYVNPNFKFATWSTSTQFTSNSSQSWSDVSVGDEVFILSGKGAGVCCKVTAISLVSTTYTVTVDYTFATVSNSDTFIVQVRNWTVLPYSVSQDPVTDQTIRYFDPPIGDKSGEIQFKLVIFGKGDSPEINQIYSISSENASLRD